MPNSINPLYKQYKPFETKSTSLNKYKGILKSNKRKNKETKP